MDPPDRNFEWDEHKFAANIRKHGVSFEEAITVFDDPLALILDDPDNSDDELREFIVGHSSLHRLHVVCFAERGQNKFRVISARKVTRKERKKYEEDLPG